MSEKVITLNSESFEADVLKSDKPVLVDYWAPWCSPCRMIAPILDAIADDPDMSSKITIGKLNIDESPEPASTYGVRNIPTLMLFKDGQVVGTLVGTNSRGQIETFINDSVS